MFQAQNRETKLVLEKLLCPPRSYDDERDKIVFHNTQNLQDQDQDQDRFFDLRPTVSDHIAVRKKYRFIVSKATVNF